MSGADTPTTDRHPVTPQLEQLLAAVWAERHLLEFLLFKVVSARLLLSAGEHRFLPVVGEEIEDVVRRCREAAAERQKVADTLAAAWDVDTGRIHLGYLAEHAPSPFAAMFSDHRDRLRQVVEEVQATARSNHQLATTTMQDVSRLIGEDAGGQLGTTYNRSGRAQPSKRTGPRQVDGSL